MILNGTKLILDDHGNNLHSFRVRLESFRSFIGPLLPKPVTGQEQFFTVFYNKPALAKGKAVKKIPAIVWLFLDQFTTVRSRASLAWVLLVLPAILRNGLFSTRNFGTI